MTAHVTRAVVLAAALFAASSSIAATSLRNDELVVTSDISKRHVGFQKRVRPRNPELEPRYYARPIYYRPYPYDLPFPFVFGFTRW
jgi:hypothetical protein